MANFMKKVIPFSLECKQWLTNTFAPLSHKHDGTYVTPDQLKTADTGYGIPDYSRAVLMEAIDNNAGTVYSGVHKILMPGFIMLASANATDCNDTAYYPTVWLSNTPNDLLMRTQNFYNNVTSDKIYGSDRKNRAQFINTYTHKACNALQYIDAGISTYIRLCCKSVCTHHQDIRMYFVPLKSTPIEYKIFTVKIGAAGDNISNLASGGSNVDIENNTIDLVLGNKNPFAGNWLANYNEYSPVNVLNNGRGFLYKVTGVSDGTYWPFSFSDNKIEFYRGAAPARYRMIMQISSGVWKLNFVDYGTGEVTDNDASCNNTSAPVGNSIISPTYWNGKTFTLSKSGNAKVLTITQTFY